MFPAIRTYKPNVPRFSTGKPENRPPEPLQKANPSPEARTKTASRLQNVGELKLKADSWG